MADFCQQCSLEDFGEDTGDFSHFSKEPKLKEGYGFPVICEGCGFICVDNSGKCISSKEEGCLRSHNNHIHNVMLT